MSFKYYYLIFLMLINIHSDICEEEGCCIDVNSDKNTYFCFICLNDYVLDIM